MFRAGRPVEQAATSSRLRRALDHHLLPTAPDDGRGHPFKIPSRNLHSENAKCIRPLIGGLTPTGPICIRVGAIFFVRLLRR
jgi:hypothetical protein